MVDHLIRRNANSALLTVHNFGSGNVRGTDVTQSTMQFSDFLFIRFQQAHFFSPHRNFRLAMAFLEINSLKCLFALVMVFLAIIGLQLTLKARYKYSKIIWKHDC